MSGPTKFAGYALGATLGGGGSTTVHVGSEGPFTGAERPRSRSLVAIKRWRRGVVGEASVATFRDEVRRASRVRHMNVATPLELCEEHGETALVSELVLGETLWMLLGAAQAAGEVTPLRVASALVCGVLQGLEAIHTATSEAGLPLALVHGDVGAHNVVVGNDGVARLTDLVTGRLVATQLRDEPRAKLAYAAPELALGERVDPRADVYAATILLFEIVTGRRPFDDLPVSRLPSQVALGLRPDDLRAARGLPRDVLGVIARGLARRPRDRYATAGEMARALVQAATPATPHEVATWAARLADPTAWGRASSLPAAPSSSAAIVLSVGSKPSITTGNIDVSNGNIDVTAPTPSRRRSRARLVTTVAMAVAGLVFGGAGLFTARAHATSRSACDAPVSVASLSSCARERLRSSSRE